MYSNTTYTNSPSPSYGQPTNYPPQQPAYNIQPATFVVEIPPPAPTTTTVVQVNKPVNNDEFIISLLV
jgi:hypothetical protein